MLFVISFRPWKRAKVILILKYLEPRFIGEQF